MINNNLYQTNYNFYKFASKEGFLKRLRDFNASQDIIDYVDSLEEKYCGIVVGAVAKNSNITLPEIQTLVDKKRSVDQLKEQTSQEVGSELPSSLDENFKEWAIIQSRKPGNRALLLSNLDKITLFFNENKEQLAQANFQLSSYDLPGLLSYIKEIEESKKSLKENLDKLSAIDQSSIKEFLSKAREYFEKELLKINNPKLVNWAKSQFSIIIENYKQKIVEACATQNKPFLHFMLEAKKIKDDMDAGKYRGQEIPDTPLRNPEYENLMSHLEFLDDWQKNTNTELGNMSVRQAINLSNAWHTEMAKSGIGLQYNPIDRSKIVYGPNNWKDEENNGFFILELTNENDLKVEGSKQSHCVGAYGDRIKNKECRIFSLRNISDVYKPILTIETDMSGSIVRQDYGPRNQKIDQKYHDMVTEWSSKTVLSDEDLLKLSTSDKIKLILKTDNENLLEKLSGDEYPSVRIAVAKKTNNENLLEKLVGDIEPEVRTEAVKKINNENLLEQLAMDEYPSVRVEVAKKTDNENLLEQLSGDEDPDVREEAVKKTKNENLLKTIANNYVKLEDFEALKFLNIIAKKTNSEDVLQILSNSESLEVKEIVADRTTNPDLLDILAQNTSFSMKKIIAFNEYTSLETRFRLMSDPSPKIRYYAVIGMQQFDENDLMDILSKIKDKNVILAIIAKTQSEDILDILSADKNYQVAKAARDKLEKEFGYTEKEFLLDKSAFTSNKINQILKKANLYYRLSAY